MSVVVVGEIVDDVGANIAAVVHDAQYLLMTEEAKAVAGAVVDEVAIVTDDGEST